MALKEEEEEEYFPRGGAKLQKRSIKSDKTYIFETKKPKLLPKKKPGKKERLRENAKKLIQDEENQVEDEVDEFSTTLSEAPFTYKNLREGTLSMCSVAQVNRTHLKVALPERLIAKVPLHLISEPLKKLISQDSTKIPFLADYFSCGICLPCRVKYISNQSNNYNITVTIDPCAVNSYIPFSSVCEGYTLVAAIQSCEDHGYIMSTGIRGLNAFLPHNETYNYVEQFNSGKKLGIGQVVWCKVRESKPSATSNVVVLTLNPDEISSAVLKAVTSTEVLTPGVQVDVAVIKVTPNFLCVKELSSDEKGFIPCSQLHNEWSKISDYNIGMEYTVTVLYKLPIVDIVCYSMRIKPNTICLSELEPGTLFQRAKIEGKDIRSVYVQLQHDCKLYKGFISMFKLKKTIDQAKLNDLFPVGNHISVRVQKYHNLDNMYSCTSSDEALQGGKISDFTTGQCVDVKITKVTKNGLLCTIGETNLQAFVPLCHIKDEVTTDPAKDIKIHNTYRGRIFAIQEHRNSAIVTLCPTLVANKPLTDFNEVEQGEDYYGVVKIIKPRGIVITFFKNLTGFISETELPKSSNKYKFGEVVKCYILRVKPDKKPLLSITKPLDHLPLKIGYNHPIVVKEVTQKGLDCIVLENKKSLDCFLPLEHLCDCLQLCPVLLKKYNIGKKILDAILYTFDDQKPIFSLRHSVNKFFEKNEEIKKTGIHALKEGDYLPATIASIGTKEMLLYLPLPGYNGQISTEIPKKLKNELKINQGIDVIVKHVNPTIRKVDVICKHTEKGLPYFRDKIEFFLIELSKHMKRTPGKIIKVKIISIDGNDLNVLLPDGSKGIIKKRDIDKFKIGASKAVVLLYEDPVEEVSHLCCRSEGLNEGASPNFRIVQLHEDFCIGITLSSKKIIFLNPIPQNALDQWVKNSGISILSSNINILAQQVRPMGKFLVGVVYWEKCLLSLLNSKKLRNEIKQNGIDAEQRENKKNISKSKDDSDDDDILYDKESSVKEEIVDNESGTLEEGENSDEDEISNAEEKSDGDEISNDEKKSDHDEISNDEENSEHIEGLDREEENIHVVKSQLKEYKLIVQTLKRRLKQESAEKPNKKKKVSENTSISSDLDSSKTENKSPLKKNQSSLNEEIKSKNIKKNTLKNQPMEKEQNISDKNKKKRSEDSLTAEEGGIKNKLPNSNVFKSDKTLKESDAARALKQRKLKELENLSLDVGGFDWNATPTDLAKTVAMGKADIVEEDSDEEVVIKKKLTPAERKAAQIEAERIIREKEEELLRCEENPKSADHFDRLLLTRPNDSKLWIQYMSFHLQGTDIDKARSIARRALKQINVREEQERLNIWIALLNMENIYGTSESFEQTLSEALKYNDDFLIYMKTIGMYCDSQKINELDKLTNHLVRKFKDRKSCWLECQRALMRAGLVDKARSFLQRSLTSLPQKEHIHLLSRFALLENKHGFHGQAQSLFENLLTSYPQRTDLWSVYVDMLVKSGFTDLARGVLERIQSHKLPVRKMRTVYKKWLQFEEKYGTEKTVEHVRQAAESYVSDFLINKNKNDNKKKTVNDSNEDEDDGDNDNENSDNSITAEDENNHKKDEEEDDEEGSDDDSEEE